MKRRSFTVEGMEREAKLHEQLAKARDEYARLTDAAAPQQTISAVIAQIEFLVKSIEAIQ